MKIRLGYLSAIPLLVAFVYFYQVNSMITTSVLFTAIPFALPLALAAMVGVMCERTGIVNIGIEGTMLVSAFTAFFIGAIVKDTVIGLAVGIVTGALV
ncbi:MAG: hypothetical protein RLZZ99_776, partial [Actinomycetota bacterium]